jgi:hypothetical protein
LGEFIKPADRADFADTAGLMVATCARFRDGSAWRHQTLYRVERGEQTITLRQ